MLKFLKSNLFFFLLLTIVVFSLYGKSIFFDFTYHDDDVSILGRVDFLSNIKNAPKLFLTSVFFLKEDPYYRPILNLSFMVDTVFCKGVPYLYHFINIVIFLFAIFFMYVFLVELKLNETIIKFLCLIIAVHPIFSSTVVWIPSRNDTLLAVFIFLSFVFFIKYLKNKSIKHQINYVLFFIFALFTKETSVFVPFLYVLLMACFNYRLNKKETIVNILIFISIFIIYFYFRKISVFALSFEQYLYNLNIYIKNIFNGIMLYVSIFLCPDYIPLVLNNIKINLKDIFIFTISISSLIYILYKNFIDKKIIIFGLFWFVLFLFPTFLLKQYVYFNHRLIVPIVGIIIILTAFIDNIIKNKKLTKKFLIILFCFLFVVFYFISFKHENNYKNKYIYWNRAYVDSPSYHVTLYCLSRLYFEKGDFEVAKKILYDILNINKVNNYISDLALIYYYEGNMDKAEELYNKSIEYGINKAQCYRNLSTIYLKRDNNLNKAIEYAKLAVQEDSYDDGYKQYLNTLENKKWQ